MAEAPDDTSRERSGRTPERTCLVTRTVRAPDEMIRFVVAPDGTVVPDLRARLPGRGAWVTATRTMVAEAVRRRAFPRAFARGAKGGTRTGEVRVPPDLADGVEAMLRADLRGALALANKAGVVVTGFVKVEAAIGALKGPGLAALVHAAEAAPDGRRKLAGALRRRLGDAISDFPVIDALSNDELDVALGRDHVIHAALVAGVGSRGCLSRWRRLRLYREGHESGTSPGIVPGAPGTDDVSAALPGDDTDEDRAGSREEAGVFDVRASAGPETE